MIGFSDIVVVDNGHHVEGVRVYPLAHTSTCSGRNSA